MPYEYQFFKKYLICFMAQPQAITYQYYLFNESGQEFIRPFPDSETLRGALGTKVMQVKEI